MSTKTEKPGLFGLLAEFETTQAVFDAANAVRKEGFTKVEAYSPFPVEGLWEAVGHKRTWLPVLVFIGGLTGATCAFFLQTLTAGAHPDSLDPLIDGTVSTLTGNMLSFNYRMNIAGRPFFSWPAFIPPIFELTILFSAFTALFGMLILNGYPLPHHPLFNNKKFERASSDRFFICIEATDPTFDREATERFLQGLKPLSVTEVPL
jgi:hypothetical protein